jgi:hypothetical protein
MPFLKLLDLKGDNKIEVLFLGELELEFEI